ncbi:MAG: hypothetical protein ACP5GH_05465 [Nitrososphaeria archaeon]
MRRKVYILFFCLSTTRGKMFSAEEDWEEDWEDEDWEEDWEEEDYDEEGEEEEF